MKCIILLTVLFVVIKSGDCATARTPDKTCLDQSWKLDPATGIMTVKITEQ